VPIDTPLMRASWRMVIRSSLIENVFGTAAAV
jgi:hypothetical protein